MIIDISHHQAPKDINYDKLAKEVDLVIIRTQYGSRLVDRHYKTHHEQFQSRGVPTAAYAWVRGVSISDMEKEATDFYNRTKSFKPTFWFLDVEERSMANMRAGVDAYLQKLRALGAEHVGVYIGHHVYKKFNIDTSAFDAVWIPHYGRNDGTLNSKPKFPCDIHQYTDRGRLPGYSSDLDLNRLMNENELSLFTKSNKQEMQTIQHKQTTYKVVTDLGAYLTADDARKGRNKKGTITTGTYYIFNESAGMINLTRSNGKPGSWINPAHNKRSTTKKANQSFYRVKKGDTLSYIAQTYGTSVAELVKLNNIKNPNYIQARKKLRIK